MLKSCFKSKFCLLIVLLSSSLSAQNLFGEFKRLPDEIEKGFYVAFDMGVSLLNGAVANENVAGETVNQRGTSLNIALGYDFIDFVSFETDFNFMIHEASPNDPILEGGVNYFLGNALIKLQLPLNRWNPFVAVGAGLIYTEPNYNNKDFNLSFGGALGVEYYTLLRHYSLFAKVSYFKLDIPVDAVVASAGLKYTF